MAFPDNTGEHPQTVEEMLTELLANQQAHREEMAQLREQIDAKKAPAPAPSSTAQSPEELLAARMEEIANHSHYCPGCGRLYTYMRECTGRPEAPHPPIDVVSTDELHGEPVGHTAAPNTDHLG